MTEPTMVILIIDHNADEVHLFSEAVKSLDFSVQCIAAYSGEQALDILRSGVVPGYIFLDMAIGEMHSMKALKALRRERGYRDIPLVIFSATLEEGDKASFRRAGADHFLVRPEEVTDLSDLLRSIINSGSAERDA